MKKRTLLFGGAAVGLITLTLLALYASGVFVRSAGALSRDAPRLIAHAGGIVKDLTYTNSLEALEENYRKGHRYFELDFNYTADGHLVLIHDWGETFLRLFGRSGRQIPTLAEFRSLKMRHGLHQLDIDDLVDWLKDHPGTFVVTDVKVDALRALGMIRERFPEHRPRFIPQIYEPASYDAARALGFERIILTLYQTAASNEEILTLAREREVFAFTMFPKRGVRGNLSRKLRALGQVVYFHTVNSPERADALLHFGAYGFYTDALLPAAKRKL